MTGDRPVLGVSVLVWEADRVLLVKRGRPPLAGTWSLPGGHVERGERLADAAAREVLEETGIAVDELRQIDIAEIMGPDEAGGIAYHFVLVVFSGRYRTGTVKAGSDAADAAWIARDKLRTVAVNESTKPYLTLPRWRRP